MNPGTSMTLEDDRVRAVSSVDSNLRIDVQTAYNISRYKRQDKRIIARRIEELDGEWDVERVLQVHGTALTLTGLVLGLAVNKKWLLLPGIMLPMLLQQGIQGWCPPLPLLRRLGLRTRLEINREKHALEPLLT